MKCAIHQPQFLPWLGYFQKMNMSDIFVFLDNVQFRKNEFQNRNRICTVDGEQWLTVPVHFHSKDDINCVRIPENDNWSSKLWRTIEYHYARAPYFNEYGPGLREIIMSDWSGLAALNMATVEWAARCIEVPTPTCVCSEMREFKTGKTERLIDICGHVGADTYLSGSQARCYLKVEDFAAAGMKVEFQQFEHPVYDQCNAAGGFVSHMSVIDGIFNVGGGERARRTLNI